MQRLPQRHLLALAAAACVLALPSAARAAGPQLLNGPTQYVNDPNLTLDWTPVGTETGYDLYSGPDCGSLTPDPGVVIAPTDVSAPVTLPAEGSYCFQLLGHYGTDPDDTGNTLTVVYDNEAPDAPEPTFDASMTIVDGVT